MCGLAGFWGGNQSTEADNTVFKMTEAILHRGPDSAGHWVDMSKGIALGHRRLAIVDLTEAGEQPMHSTSGRWVMAFNGEIYNHKSLRVMLQANARPWRGCSDTETLLAAFENWGIDSTLNRCVGMFSIALWDKITSTLTLVVDRFGEKPMYYGWVGQGAKRAFGFGSEMRALLAYPGFEAKISRKSLTQYTQFMCVPAPNSIYEGIYKLEPGCLLTIEQKSITGQLENISRCTFTDSSLKSRRWWSLNDVVIAGSSNPVLDESDAVVQLEDTLIDAVNLQCQADVPLGAFLSGGVDSASIVALMQRQSSQPIKTFTIGLDDADYDESRHALDVATYLGTEHYNLRLDGTLALSVIYDLPNIYDEPFSDSSQIPTHFVCRLARQHVTVALSGDAGDELFGGYNRYLWGPKIWRQLSRVPMPLRQIIGKLALKIPSVVWNEIVSEILGATTADRLLRLSEKVYKLARSLQSAHNLYELHQNLRTVWLASESPVKQTPAEPTINKTDKFNDPPLSSVITGEAHSMMYTDSMSYLSEDILCKLDRAAMSVGLETRVPFLDHRVVELAWRLPESMKIRNNQGKWALRQVLYKHVPKELIERPKSGFSIPIGRWLRGPLREWAETLLDEVRLNREGYFHPGQIRTSWLEHLSGRRDHTEKIWNILMFQAWLDTQPTSAKIAK